MYLSIRRVIEQIEVIIDAYHSRLTPFAEEINGDHHRGFRCNRATTHLILCIRQMPEKKWEFRKALHRIFIGFKKPMIPIGGRIL
jgi:hypothetical protein